MAGRVYLKLNSCRENIILKELLWPGMLKIPFVRFMSRHLSKSFFLSLFFTDDKAQSLNQSPHSELVVGNFHLLPIKLSSLSNNAALYCKILLSKYVKYWIKANVLIIIEFSCIIL